MLILSIFLHLGQGLNSTMYSNIKNHAKLFNSLNSNNFMFNTVRILAFLFFFIGIILCNINNQEQDSDFFWKNSNTQKIKNDNTSFLDKSMVYKDIPS
jgi:preprotein translocase subunit SecG